MIKWGHMNVYIFTWKHSQSNAFFLLFWNLFVLNFTRCFTAPPPMCKTSNFWLNGLGSQHSGAHVARANKPMADDVDVKAIARGTPGFNGAGEL